MQRKIMHIDMDAFFASVEQLDHPEYRGKPVIVGGRERGVVAACSYEARKFGVHSAMPSATALRLCPQAIVAKSRMGRYSEVSRQVMAVLDNFSPLVEQASVDEAYLDVTGTERLFGDSDSLARRIKREVLQATGLKCSVGIAPVKFLAKIASDYNKPDGLFVLEDEAVPEFMRTLPVKAIPGVGKKSLGELEKLGVSTCGDIRRFSAPFWESRLGKAGRILYERAGGFDPREVEPYTEAKSESAENTFHEDTDDRELLRKWMLVQSERVSSGLRKMEKTGRTITLKVKFSDFRSITRSRSLPEATDVTDVIFRTACELLENVALEKKVRLIGVGVSNFYGETAQEQLSLFGEMRQEAGHEDRRKLDLAIDALRNKFGNDAVVRGRIFNFTKKK